MTNQVLKYLYSKLSKLVIENSDKESQNFERADKIIIWIVGFSIGIFVILFTKDYDNKNPNYLVLQQLSYRINIFALIVIIFGLIFRLFSFFTQMLLTQINLEFAGYAEGFSSAPEFPIPRKIKDADTIDDIIFYFEQDFGIKQNRPDYNSLSIESTEEYRKLLLNYYLTLSEGNNFERQLEEYKNKISEYYGVSQEQKNKQFSGNSEIKTRGKIYRVFLLVSYIFFFLTIGTFISGAIIVLINLLVNSPAHVSADLQPR